MRCPHCGNPESRVIDSREATDGIRRRRECVACGLRFTTYERVQTAALVVAKRDGRREPFIRDKLLSSIRLACAKRPMPIGTLEKLVDEIEGQLQGLGRAEIPSSLIGEMVIERLKRLDTVAYIRFASVYRDFDDLTQFQEEIAALQQARAQAPPGPGEQLALLPQEIAERRQRRARRAPRPRPGQVVRLPEARQG
ncbi:MAG: transcriptional repressor NrdR [Chloroflexi bacterium]|nr:transcriptional repressor NrdR [Chloroflexota bacterium]